MANGTYVQEFVTVAGLTIPNQFVGLAAETEDIYGGMTEGYSDGIMGFGFPGMNSLRGYELDDPFVFNLANNNLNPGAIFSIYLNSQFEYGYSGEIMLSGIDDSKYTGSLTYAPLASYTLGTSTGQIIQDVCLYWTLGGAGIQTSTGFAEEGFNYLHWLHSDIWTERSHRPSRLIHHWNECPSEGLRRVLRRPNPLSNPLNMTAPIREMIIPWKAHTAEEAQECFLGVAHAGQPFLGIAYWYVLGESVMRSFYTVHDMARHRIGIAPAAFIQKSNGITGNSNASTL